MGTRLKTSNKEEGMEIVEGNGSVSRKKGKLERVLSSDGSCAVSENDLRFIAMNSNMSLKELRNIFKDLSHGNIDKMSFMKFVGLCYPDIDLDRLQSHVYKVFDTNETGYIDLRKMMLVIIALSSGDPEENVEMMFYIVDLNNDGVITAEEYQIVTKDIFLLANEKKISTANNTHLAGVNKDHLTKSSFNEMDSNLD